MVLHFIAVFGVDKLLHEKKTVSVIIKKINVTFIFKKKKTPIDKLLFKQFFIKNLYFNIIRLRDVYKHETRKGF